jgi:hypothetical protein
MYSQRPPPFDLMAFAAISSVSYRLHRRVVLQGEARGAILDIGTLTGRSNGVTTRATSIPGLLCCLIENQWPAIQSSRSSWKRGGVEVHARSKDGQLTTTSARARTAPRLSASNRCRCPLAKIHRERSIKDAFSRTCWPSRVIRLQNGLRPRRPHVASADVRPRPLLPWRRRSKSATSKRLLCTVLPSKSPDLSRRLRDRNR